MKSNWKTNLAFAIAFIAFVLLALQIPSRYPKSDDGFNAQVYQKGKMMNAVVATQAAQNEIPKTSMLLWDSVLISDKFQAVCMKYRWYVDNVQYSRKSVFLNDQRLSHEKADWERVCQDQKLSDSNFGGQAGRVKQEW
jgi:hypothetical protein